LIDMTMNMPPEPGDRVLLQRLRDGMVSVAQEVEPYDMLRYQEFGGSVQDRDAGARWMSRHVPGLSSTRVLVCPGIQSTLMALCSMFTGRAGDAIACERVTYPGLKGIATQLGIRLIGLPADDEGIDPEAFGALCASDLPKALYVNPTYNNPTTSVMSQVRREAVVEIARRYSIPIIEDDPYGCLPVRRPAALAALAPELTFYLTGFAKCLGAGLRIAYVECDGGSRAGASGESLDRRRHHTGGDACDSQGVPTTPADGGRGAEERPLYCKTRSVSSVVDRTGALEPD
jgi:DNA-binding transcriptional MocR family regulator